ncbi:MAG: flagellar hook-basal body complex protein [Rhodospirillales bacterium]|nr:flagellar hook-basal body complex protein [Rhodospirillales bacterium]
MLWGAFTNSMTAMMSQSHAMNVISQNVANVNTGGYKSAVDTFRTILSETTAGTNLLGVTQTTRQSVESQGNVLSTGENLDMAINGQGMFLLSGEAGQPANLSDYVFGRYGSFQWTVDQTASASTASAQDYDVVYDDSWNGTETNGDNPAASNQVTYLTTSDGYYLLGYAADPETGEFTTSSSLSGLSAIRTDRYGLAGGQATDSIDLRANVDSETEATDSASFNIPVYKQVENPDSGVTDYLSDQINFVMTPDPSQENVWSLELTCGSNGTSGTTVGGPYTLTFDGDGNLTSVVPDDGSGGLSIKATVEWNDIDFSSASTASGSLTPASSTLSIDLTKLTQLSGDSKIGSYDQNGNVNGYLKDSYFTSDGFLVGSYSNGETKQLYQIPVATFNAVNQMEALSGTLWAYNENAGDIVVRSQGVNDEGLTSWTANAVEQSNVVLEDEFTNMILTQKAYSMASKVFQTADEMTVTVRDLK